MYRRNRLDLMHPAERIIFDAMQAIEKLPADTRLTDAQIHLTKAKDLVSDYLDKEGFEGLAASTGEGKHFGNTTASGAKQNVKDIVFWGNGDTFKLISKASSQNEGWMKSTKAMEIIGVGCVLQITTQQGSNVAEAAVFVPGVHIEEIFEGDKVIARKLVNSNP
jgi:membrane-bound inhibitor of C-type lysozyme